MRHISVPAQQTRPIDGPNRNRQGSLFNLNLDGLSGSRKTADLFARLTILGHPDCLNPTPGKLRAAVRVS